MGRVHSHGAVTPSLSNKDIDLFMSEFVDSIRQSSKRFELTIRMRQFLIRHPAVFNNNDELHIVKDMLLAMGTNDILRVKNERNTGSDNANILASTALILEHYAETNDINASLYMTYPKTRDIGGGGDRETLRFFSKRVSCTCLDSLICSS